jgi:hypothetical protein
MAVAETIAIAGLTSLRSDIAVRSPAGEAELMIGAGAGPCKLSTRPMRGK